MDKKYTFSELELNPLKQFMFAPCDQDRLVLENEHYKEQAISILLSAEDRLNAGIVLQANSGECTLIMKLDLTAKEWEFAKDKVISPDVPVVIIPVPEKRGAQSRKEGLKILLKPLDYYAILIQQPDETWEISEVEPYTEPTIKLREERYDYLASCEHYTTEMPEISPVKEETWRQKFIYNGVEFYLIARGKANGWVDFSLEPASYGIGRDSICEMECKSEKEILSIMERMIYDLYRHNPRTSELGQSINECLKQIDLNGFDWDLIDDFVNYGITDEELEELESGCSCPHCGNCDEYDDCDGCNECN